MTAWVLTWEEIGNWFWHFHSLSVNPASLTGYFSRHHRVKKKRCWSSHCRQVSRTDTYSWCPLNICTQPIRAIHSQGSMKGNNGTSVQIQRLHLHQQCSIKALTCIQAIQKPQPSISGQQICSQGRLMHPKSHLQLLIGWARARKKEKKSPNEINFLTSSS